MTNSHITNFVNAVVSKISALIGSHDSDSTAHSTLFASKSDTGHTHTKSEVTDFPTSMTPTSHRATGTTYGVGNASYYGHCRCVNNLSKSSHTDGYALSAYQGYMLNQNKVDKVSGKGLSTNDFTNADKNKLDDLPSKHITNIYIDNDGYLCVTWNGEQDE